MYAVKFAGYSLVQLLVVVSIVTISFAIFSTMQLRMSTEFQMAQQRLAAIEVEGVLNSLFKDGAILDFQVNNSGPWIAQAVPVVFDSGAINSSSVVVNFNQILNSPKASAPVVLMVGEPASALSGSLIVESIRIQGLTTTPGSDEYSANLIISFVANRLIRPLNPISIPLRLFTTGPANAKTITGGTARIAGVSIMQSFNFIQQYNSECQTGGFSNPPGAIPSSAMQTIFCFSACNRYCGSGCDATTIGGNCPAPISGLGYSGGALTQYSGLTNRVECLCIP